MTNKSRIASFNELSNIYLDLTIQDLQLAREKELKGIDSSPFREMAKERLRLSESFSRQAKELEEEENN